jgi:small subunit ribosomal protein S20
MANKASAKKALRQTKKRTALNDAKRRRVKETMKAIEKALKEGNKDIEALVVKAQKALDKAAKNNVIHKNKASRLKSQLAKRTKKA